MEFNQYQYKTASTATYPGAGSGTEGTINYNVNAIASEAGEIAGKWSKYYRDSTAFAETRAQLLKEAGDVLWHLARLITELGESFENVAQDNLRKLADRHARNVISGSGDNR